MTLDEIYRFVSEEIVATPSATLSVEECLLGLQLAIDDWHKGHEGRSRYKPTQLIQGALAGSVLCMTQQGIVRRAIAPLQERIVSRGKTDIKVVFALLSRELEYTDMVESNRRGGARTFTRPAFALYAKTYLQKATDAWVLNGDFAALDELRKLAALFVRYLEELN